MTLKTISDNTRIKVLAYLFQAKYYQQSKFINVHLIDRILMKRDFCIRLLNLLPNYENVESRLMVLLNLFLGHTNESAFKFNHKENRAF